MLTHIRCRLKLGNINLSLGLSILDVNTFNILLTNKNNACSKYLKYNLCYLPIASETNIGPLLLICIIFDKLYTTLYEIFKSGEVSNLPPLLFYPCIPKVRFLLTMSLIYIILIFGMFTCIL